MKKLLGHTPDSLKEIAAACGLPAFAGKQIAQWLYQKKVRDIGGMTNLSKAGREALAAEYEVGITPPSDCRQSYDGTRKYLFPVVCQVGNKEERFNVEAVMIPEEDRRTLCISSQAGCRMGCRFCATGQLGFHGNLSAADILSQIIAVDESDDLTNIVFMGMGEPLDNYDNVRRVIEVLTAPWGFGWSPKRITLSTIGVIPKLERFLAETRCHLAVSLHNPFPDERRDIMPVQKAFDIRDVIDLLRRYDFSGQRRVSFEYTMFSGLNDDKRHADALVRLLRGLECRVNLIRFHRIPGFEGAPPSEGVMTVFRDRVAASGIPCTIRASRGEDIDAACGMLAGKNQLP